MKLVLNPNVLFHHINGQDEVDSARKKNAQFDGIGPSMSTFSLQMLRALFLATILVGVLLSGNMRASGHSEASTAPPEAKPGDVDTIEHIIAAAYEVISGPAGSRDWQRLHSLYYPDARLIASGRDSNGQITARDLSVDQ